MFGKLKNIARTTVSGLERVEQIKVQQSARYSADCIAAVMKNADHKGRPLLEATINDAMPQAEFERTVQGIMDGIPAEYHETAQLLEKNMKNLRGLSQGNESIIGTLLGLTKVEDSKKQGVKQVTDQVVGEKITELGKVGRVGRW